MISRVSSPSSCTDTTANHNLHRCPSDLRKVCQQVDIQTRDHSSCQTALSLFPRLRIEVWRALASQQARAAYARALPGRSVIKAICAPLPVHKCAQPDVRPNAYSPDHLPSHANASGWPHLIHREIAFATVRPSRVRCANNHAQRQVA